ncbi:hypothetical protein [Brucella intermedia]|uniref:hypothetical protein n=1 Tax=Brucella intermedia TaxID=94625 RepID=UPI00224A8353|nr:hypothetical protein [Brucella intermedia]
MSILVRHKPIPKPVLEPFCLCRLSGRNGGQFNCPSLDLNNEYIDSLGEGLENIKPMQDATFNKRMNLSMNYGATDTERFCDNAIERFHKDAKAKSIGCPIFEKFGLVAPLKMKKPARWRDLLNTATARCKLCLRLAKPEGKTWQADQLGPACRQTGFFRPPSTNRHVSVWRRITRLPHFSQ